MNFNAQATSAPAFKPNDWRIPVTSYVLYFRLPGTGGSLSLPVETRGGSPIAQAQEVWDRLARGGFEMTCARP